MLNLTYGFTYEYIIKINYKVPRQTLDLFFYINYLKVTKMSCPNIFEEKQNKTKQNKTIWKCGILSPNMG